ncbi:MAG: sulfate transporter CysZ [Pontibacterium sp.]
MGGNPIRGASYLVKGLQMLPDPRIRHFVLIPLLINIVLFTGAIWLLISQFEIWVDYWLSFLPDWLSFLSWLLWPLFSLLVLLVVYYGFNLVANLIAAPFNGLLSEKVEKLLRGDIVTDEGWKAVLALVPRAVAREFSKLAYYLPRFLFLLVISFIPGLNVIAPLLWFLFGAWMMAIQYCDYPMDNNKVSFAQMKLLLKAQRLTSVGFGSLVQLGMMIPVINLVLMPAAVVGATFYWVDEHAAPAEKPVESDQERLDY